MLDLIPDLPEGVIGFSASGQVSAGDYARVLIPAVEMQLKQRPRLRLLYHLGPAFTGFTAGAMWDDVKVGLKHLGSWERIALVTDVEWLRKSVPFVAFAIPGEVRLFGNTERGQAIAWLGERAPPTA
jgi:hypothetical protein